MEPSVTPMTVALSSLRVGAVEARQRTAWKARTKGMPVRMAIQTGKHNEDRTICTRSNTLHHRVDAHSAYL